jgi:hypothetical protein
MDYLQNLEKEYKDICAKKGALAHFLEYGNHENLNNGEEGLLWAQFATMEAYSNVLYQRLKLRKKTLRDSNMEVMVEGKTVAELYTEYRNGERDL